MIKLLFLLAIIVSKPVIGQDLNLDNIEPGNIIQISDINNNLNSLLIEANQKNVILDISSFVLDNKNPKASEFNYYLNQFNSLFKDESSPLVLVNSGEYISAQKIKDNLINVKNKLDTIPYQKKCGEVKITHPEYTNGSYYIDPDGFNPNPPILSSCDFSGSVSESMNPHSCREAKFYDNSLVGNSLVLIDPDGWNKGIQPFTVNCNFNAQIPYSSDTIIYIDALGVQGNRLNLDVVGEKTIGNNGVYTNSFLIKDEPSLRFNGKYLSFAIGNDSRFDLRTQDITFEGWYFIHDTTPFSKNYTHFFSIQNQGFFALKAHPSYIYGHGGSGSFIVSDVGLPNQILFHLALVKKGNQISLYINGRLSSRVNSSAMSKDMRNKTLYMGYGHPEEPSDYSARKLRISNRALYHTDFEPLF